MTDFITEIRARLAARIRELAQDEDRAGLPATAAVYRECAAEVERIQRPRLWTMRAVRDVLTRPTGSLPSGSAPEDVLAERIDEAVSLIDAATVGLCEREPAARAGGES